MIRILSVTTFFDPFTSILLYRNASISITNNGISYAWSIGGLPLEGDLQSLLDARFDELWKEASEAKIPVPEYEYYSLPIKTPAVYAEDIFVSSRTIKDDPNEAFLEAMLETGKAKGEPKSLDLISRSTLKALERAREEITTLMQEQKKMWDDIKDLKKKLK